MAVWNSVGFIFSIPQEGLIRERLHCEIYASIGWIPVTKVVASKLCGVKILYEYSYMYRICFANYDKVHWF